MTNLKTAVVASILFFAPLIGSSANLDNAAWLIYDQSYGDYFLLRIEMKTSKTGYARIAGSNEWAGRRYTGQYNRFDVNMLGGKLTIDKEGATPFMIGRINERGDEFSGDFLAENGSIAGSFVGALQGHTNHKMDLFQFCREYDYDDFHCANRGNDQRCKLGAYQQKSTFFSQSNCNDALPSHANRQQSASITTLEDWDPTGTWLFYDEAKNDYVLGRFSFLDRNEKKGNLRGQVVFSLGLNDKGQHAFFGRRNIGKQRFRNGKTYGDGSFSIEKSGDVVLRHSSDVHIMGKVDFLTNTMRGDFAPRNRYKDNIGRGTWIAEKKSDDPEFEFPLYQYCKANIEEAGGYQNNHLCKNVGSFQSDGAGRDCAVGYSGGTITFLSEQECLRGMWIRCRSLGRNPKGDFGTCYDAGFLPKN